MKQSHFLLLLGLLGGTAIAWQSAMTTLGLTQQQLQTTLLSETDNTSPSVSLPYFGPAVIAKAKAMTEQQRAAAVREIGGLIKTLVMSAAFQQAHAAQIKSSHNAVDHGFKEKVETDPLAAAERQLAVQMAMAYRSFPTEALKETFKSDQENWTENAKSSDPEDRALAQKLLARAKQIAPLQQSNPEQFKQVYSLLKSEELKGPTTEAELLAAAKGAQSDQTLRVEQSAWNEYNLKAVLKKKLTSLVAEAGTVDFTAQLKDEAGRKVFANPAHERRGYLWKAMYRAGKAPTAALVEIANGWLKEL